MSVKSGIIPLTDFPFKEVNRQFVPGKTAHGLASLVVRQFDGSVVGSNKTTTELLNYETIELTS